MKRARHGYRMPEFTLSWYWRPASGVSGVVFGVQQETQHHKPLAGRLREGVGGGVVEADCGCRWLHSESIETVNGWRREIRGNRMRR